MKPSGIYLEASWLRAAPAQRVMRAVERAGGRILFVGGCVRDTVMGRPVGDRDMATDLPPTQVMAALQAAGIKAIPTGLDHGTVTAVADHDPFEITTLRVDVKTHGRHADVAFTDSWQADAARRDFTFNALYASADGTVYDPAGGLADAQLCRVRFIGDAEARIREDALRILRFFRFHAHFGAGAPDRAGVSACIKRRRDLQNLSAERIRAELLRLLAAFDPVPVLAVMAEAGLLSHLLPRHDLQALRHLVDSEDVLRTADVLRRLAVIITPKTDVDVLAKQLRLSRDEKKRLSVLASLPSLAVRPQALQVQLYALGPAAVTDMAVISLSRAQCTPAQARAALRQVKNWQAPKFPLTGKDVKAAGIPAGRQVGTLLRQLEQAWLDSGFRLSRTQLLALLKKLTAPA